MHGGNGLDAAQIIRTHMRQLQVPRPLFLESPVQPLDPVIHPVRGFRAHDDCRPRPRILAAGEGRLVDDNVQLLPRHKLVQPDECGPAMRPEFPGLRRSKRTLPPGQRLGSPERRRGHVAPRRAEQGRSQDGPPAQPRTVRSPGNNPGALDPPRP
jgi:hypothetical protein